MHGLTQAEAMNANHFQQKLFWMLGHGDCRTYDSAFINQLFGSSCRNNIRSCAYQNNECNATSSFTDVNKSSPGHLD